jgi:hypothetical protein
MLQRILAKARDRPFWPPDPENWERVKRFANELENVLNTAVALKL